MKMDVQEGRKRGRSDSRWLDRVRVISKRREEIVLPSYMEVFIIKRRPYNKVEIW